MKGSVNDERTRHNTVHRLSDSEKKDQTTFTFFFFTYECDAATAAISLLRAACNFMQSEGIAERAYCAAVVGFGGCSHRN